MQETTQKRKCIRKAHHFLFSFLFFMVQLVNYLFAIYDVHPMT